MNLGKEADRKIIDSAEASGWKTVNKNPFTSFLEMNGLTIVYRWSVRQLVYAPKGSAPDDPRKG